MTVVALGAFGAHALKEILSQEGTTAIWEKAAAYHLVHSVVLLVLARGRLDQRIAWWLFAAGILVFCGSLYLLAFTGVRWLGAVTPVGGLCLLGGWLVLILKAGGVGEAESSL